MSPRLQPRPAPAESPWIGCHIHYHGDQDLLLRDLLKPQVREDLAGGSIDRFFFVRYALGGPHLRLRCRLAPGADAGEILSAIETRARDFFARCPSRQPWTDEQVRRRNRAILANDPAEHDGSIYPDESLRAVPFQPETERYGGAELLSSSLELFTLSSVAALDTLAGCHAVPRGLQLNAFLRHLGRQAWAAVASGEELLDLLDHLTRPAHEAFPLVLERADRAFAERPEVFVRLLAAAVEADADGAGLADGTAWLRCRLAAADEPGKRRILASHLHMSANRLGLSNAEEAYLYRLLHRAAESLREARGDLFGRLNDDFAERAARSARAEDELAAIVDSSLHRFVGGASAAGRTAVIVEPFDHRIRRQCHGDSRGPGSEIDRPDR
jgi:hypothetical protein